MRLLVLVRPCRLVVAVARGPAETQRPVGVELAAAREDGHCAPARQHSTHMLEACAKSA